MFNLPITILLFTAGGVAGSINSYGDPRDAIHHKIGSMAPATWPNNIIPYEISPDFDQQDLTSIAIAIGDYNAKTCIRWRPRTTEPDYVQFFRNVSGQGCAYATTVGFRRGLSYMVFENCRGINTFIHEMGHVAGFGHTQGRYERDDFVYQRGSNCGGLGGKGEYESFLHLYDYLSVMHYFCDDCLAPKLPGVPYCGQYFEGGRLSVLDAENLNDLYRCNAPGESHRFRLPSQLNPSTAFQVPVGQNGWTDAICRGYVQGSILVGAARGTLEACWLPNPETGGEQGMSSGYEILQNFTNYMWVPSNFGSQMPKYIVTGGRTKTHETVYIGLCQNLVVDGGISVGQRVGSVFASNPNEVVVTYGFKLYRCANPLVIYVK